MVRLGRAGVGHAAVLRDPSARTPVGGLPRRAHAAATAGRRRGHRAGPFLRGGVPRAGDRGAVACAGPGGSRRGRRLPRRGRSWRSWKGGDAGAACPTTRRCWRRRREEGRGARGRGRGRRAADAATRSDAFNRLVGAVRGRAGSRRRPAKGVPRGQPLAGGSPARRASADPEPAEPIVVFGEAVLAYDFGPQPSADAAPFRPGHRPAARRRRDARSWNRRWPPTSSWSACTIAATSRP